MVLNQKYGITSEIILEHGLDIMEFTIIGSTNIKWKFTTNITKSKILVMPIAVRKIIVVMNVRHFIQPSKGNSILKKSIAASAVR